MITGIDATITNTVSQSIFNIQHPFGSSKVQNISKKNIKLKMDKKHGSLFLVKYQQLLVA
jgi:hypothetical protein